MSMNLTDHMKINRIATKKKQMNSVYTCIRFEIEDGCK